MMAIPLIILAILIIMLLPLCAELNCENGKISASVTLFKIPIYLYPKRNKSTKKKNEKKHDAKLRIAKTVLKTVRSSSLTMLKLRFISAGDDPYDAVMKYSIANAIAGYFYLFINAENKDIVIKTDLNAQKSEFSAFMGLKIRLYKLVFAISKGG